LKVVVVFGRYYIGSTTQAYIVTLNSSASYSVLMSARGTGLPYVNGNSTHQVSTNCSSGSTTGSSSQCQMELVSPLVNSWHYLTVNNWLNETSLVNLHVLTSG